MEILWNTHVYNRKVLLKSLKKEKFTNKNGSHSALNMFTEYSMTDPGDLAEYFGFTEQEISALCEKYEMSFEEAKTWYDGYQLITHRQTGDEIIDSVVEHENFRNSGQVFQFCFSDFHIFSHFNFQSTLSSPETQIHNT